MPPSGRGEGLQLVSGVGARYFAALFEAGESETENSCGAVWICEHRPPYPAYHSLSCGLLLCCCGSEISLENSPRRYCGSACGLQRNGVFGHGLRETCCRRSFGLPVCRCFVIFSYEAQEMLTENVAVHWSAPGDRPRHRSEAL